MYKKIIMVLMIPICMVAFQEAPPPYTPTNEVDQSDFASLVTGLKGMKYSFLCLKKNKDKVKKLVESSYFNTVFTQQPNNNSTSDSAYSINWNDSNVSANYEWLISTWRKKYACKRGYEELAFYVIGFFIYNDLQKKNVSSDTIHRYLRSYFNKKVDFVDLYKKIIIPCRTFSQKSVNTNYSISTDSLEEVRKLFEKIQAEDIPARFYLAEKYSYNPCCIPGHTIKKLDIISHQ